MHERGITTAFSRHARRRVQALPSYQREDRLMSIKSSILLCGAAALAALVPTAASARGTFSISIGSGYSNGYSGYGYPGYGYGNSYGYGANRYSQYGRHEEEHDGIDDEHGDAHDQIEEEHAEAHAQGVDPWQHAQVHRQLRYQHNYTHDQLERQHEYQHELDEWRRRSQSYDYYGY